MALTTLTQQNIINKALFLQQKKQDKRNLIRLSSLRKELIGDNRRIIIIYSATEYKYATIFDLIKPAILQKEYWLVHFRINKDIPFDTISGRFNHNPKNMSKLTRTNSITLIKNIQITLKKEHFKIIKSKQNSNFYLEYLENKKNFKTNRRGKQW